MKSSLAYQQEDTSGHMIAVTVADCTDKLLPVLLCYVSMQEKTGLWWNCPVITILSSSQKIQKTTILTL